jgi:putative ABC transport system substrate-binding protein
MITLRLRQALACALLLLTHASAAAPAPPEETAPAASPTAPVRIQVLQSNREAPLEQALAGFRRGIADALGPEGQAFELSIHLLAPGDEEKGAKAVRGHDKAALLYAMGSSATKLARKIAGDRPTVFSMVVNPVTQGLYDPAGKDPVTGVSMDVSFAEQFDALKRVLPRAKRVGVVHQASNLGLVQRARDAARARGLELIGVSVNTSDQIPNAFEGLTGKVDALWSFADSLVYSPNLAQFIILHTLRNRLPFMGVSLGYVKAGALFCVYADYHDLGRQAAEMAVEILKGKPPSSIPMQSPRQSKMALNLSAAEAIGQDIPLQVRKTAAEKF